MWDGHSCPSPLTLILLLLLIPDLEAPSSQSKSKVKSDGQECPSHINRPPGDFDFPCRESKPQWTYARRIPPFAANAKNGPPGNVTKNVGREKCGTDTPVRRL